jgi:hypothetical protein
MVGKAYLDLEDVAKLEEAADYEIVEYQTLRKEAGLAVCIPGFEKRGFRQRNTVGM